MSLTEKDTTTAMPLMPVNSKSNWDGHRKPFLNKLLMKQFFGILVSTNHKNSAICITCIRVFCYGASLYPPFF